MVDIHYFSIERVIRVCSAVQVPEAFELSDSTGAHGITMDCTVGRMVQFTNSESQLEQRLVRWSFKLIARAQERIVTKAKVGTAERKLVRTCTVANTVVPNHAASTFSILKALALAEVRIPNEIFWASFWLTLLTHAAIRVEILARFAVILSDLAVALAHHVVPDVTLGANLVKAEASTKREVPVIPLTTTVTSSALKLASVCVELQVWII